MIAIQECAHEDFKKNGKDRNGQQRYKCRSCGKTWIAQTPRPLGNMRIAMDRALIILNMLLEGTSIRACERITGVHRDTIDDLILVVGENCQRFLSRTVTGVASRAIEIDETRYSPAQITGIEKKVRYGSPDMDRVSTSYVERFNLTFRMQNRRFTRLTNAHSKSLRHHTAMQAIVVAWYNFCRAHETLSSKELGQRTPAMASGLADEKWSTESLLAATSSLP